MTTVTLNNREITVLMKQNPASKSNGGYQGLMVKLQSKLVDGSLMLTSTELERIQRYAFDYGRGGWEDRFKAIFSRTLGPNLGRN